MGGCTKIGEQTLPQQTLPSCENATMAMFLPPWYGQVATPGVAGDLLCLAIHFYLLLVFPFQLQDLTKQPLIFGFNHLIWEDPFQPVFNLSDLPRSALISNLF